MNDTIMAITVLIGKVDEFWIPGLIDQVEWTDPKYKHQN